MRIPLIFCLLKNTFRQEQTKKRTHCVYKVILCSIFIVLLQFKKMFLLCFLLLSRRLYKPKRSYCNRNCGQNIWSTNLCPSVAKLCIFWHGQEMNSKDFFVCVRESQTKRSDTINNGPLLTVVYFLWPISFVHCARFFGCLIANWFQNCILWNKRPLIAPQIVFPFTLWLSFFFIHMLNFV